ncbi:GNAT family N-acetyltransferase [Kribbella sp. NPDC020789]
MDIRDGRLDDLDQLAELNTLARPYAVGSRTGVRYWLTKADGVSYVAEENGQPIGWTAVGRADWLDDDDSYTLQVLVHPEFRRRGVGTRLLRMAEEWLGRSPSWQVQAMADETGIEFARQAGFTLGAELTYAGVDLTTDQPPVVQIPDGLTLVPLADLTAQDVFPAYQETCLDIPAGTAIDPAYDWYVEHVWQSELFDRELSLALLDDGAVVAFTISLRDGERLWTDMTGTVASHRGRGLASAVKSAALVRARDAGVTAGYTAMNVTNEPMLAANRRMGYRAVGLRAQLTKVR